MDLLRRLWTWFMGLQITLKAAIVAGMFAIVAAIVGAILHFGSSIGLHYLTRQPVRIEREDKPLAFMVAFVSSDLMLPNGKLSEKQRVIMEKCRYQTKMKIANESGKDIIDMLVYVPTKGPGLAEATNEFNRTSVFDWENERFTIPKMRPFGHAIVTIWHQEPLRLGETVKIASANFEKMEIPIKQPPDVQEMINMSMKIMDAQRREIDRKNLIIVVLGAAVGLQLLWYLVRWIRKRRATSPTP